MVGGKGATRDTGIQKEKYDPTAYNSTLCRVRSRFGGTGGKRTLEFVRSWKGRVAPIMKGAGEKKDQKKTLGNWWIRESKT